MSCIVYPKHIVYYDICVTFLCPHFFYFDDNLDFYFTSKFTKKFKRYLAF